MSNYVLEQWAITHGISDAAMSELDVIMGTAPEGTVGTAGTAYSESRVQSEIRLEASAKGCRLWRNNVGALKDERSGRLVRYGLCNDSPALNKSIKSSDLIGIKPVIITLDMVGTTIGQFIAREVKHSYWIYSGTPREAAQLKFLNFIMSMGGDAKFATSTGTV